ncbi:hypothetical protein D3C72_2094470 [compost metagenome]
MFFHFRLFCIALGLSALACSRGGLGIARLPIERRLFQAGVGIAIDAPGSDPVHLLAKCLFQAGGRWERLIPLGLLRGERLGGGWQAESYLPPGIETLD